MVELFTSEGCSSCPPADALLQRLAAQQTVAGAQILALEEHVDYWDHDGWVDPFSSPAWTERQQDYAALFKNDPYTPEMVVDGRSGFVGNNARQAQAEIEKAARSQKIEVAISSETPPAKGSGRFRVRIGQLKESTAGEVAEVWLAVTEDGLHSSVSHGENAGHTLRHVSTLRSLRKIGVADAHADSASFSAEPAVKLDTRWNSANLHVIVFVQEKRSRRILGAASSAVNRETASQAISAGPALATR